MAVSNMNGKPTFASVLAGSVVFLTLVSAAQAHMLVEGAGDMANGALHPLISPAHMLILVGLALVLGQQVPFELKIPVRIFAPVSAVALMLTMLLSLTEVWPPLLLGLALCLGTIVGLELRLPRLVLALLCAVVAIGIGVDSAVESESTGTKVKALLGTWLAINAIVFYLAICVSNGANKKWARTGIRVIGSWIIAISLMVLAFTLAKK